MSRKDDTPKSTEERIVELERYVMRLRIGLIAVASLILWQATSEMGWLGPIRVYATEVYASEFILEDAQQNVHGRWEVSEEQPAQLTVFGTDAHYALLNADGLDRRHQQDAPQ